MCERVRFDDWTDDAADHGKRAQPARNRCFAIDNLRRNSDFVMEAPLGRAWKSTEVVGWIGEGNSGESRVTWQSAAGFL
jgi:hypothetical protein